MDQTQTGFPQVDLASQGGPLSPALQLYQKMFGALPGLPQGSPSTGVAQGPQAPQSWRDILLGLLPMGVGGVSKAMEEGASDIQNALRGARGDVGARLASQAAKVAQEQQDYAEELAKYKQSVDPGSIMRRATANPEGPVAVPRGSFEGAREGLARGGLSKYYDQPGNLGNLQSLTHFLDPHSLVQNVLANWHALGLGN